MPVTRRRRIKDEITSLPMSPVELKRHIRVRFSLRISSSLWRRNRQQEAIRRVERPIGVVTVKGSLMRPFVLR
jgi:hypothetical protein